MSASILSFASAAAVTMLAGALAGLPERWRRAGSARAEHGA
jgi:hypothetical protein